MKSSNPLVITDAPMNPILVRPATLADVDTLNRFQQGIVAAERPFDPTIKAGPVQYYDTAQMLTSDQVQFVVAESGSQIIGCGFARIETAKPYLAHANHCYLGMMYVDPKYRGQSVSKQIIDALKEWCLSKDVRELRLEVYHDNDSAVRAYEKSGFRRLMTEMRLNLSEE
jgi:ribosomal protein S18 acetylase RimI-like enzyme